MKNIYFNSELNNRACYLFLQLFFLFGMIVTANGQLRVPFTQRTSQYTPDKKIYNIKGDYAMIGNTNMTLQNYAENTQNIDTIVADARKKDYIKNKEELFLNNKALKLFKYFFKRKLKPVSNIIIEKNIIFTLYGIN